MKYDLIGRQFGKLIVIEYLGSDPSAPSKTKKGCWKCECNCKAENRNTKIVITNHLLSGAVASCGCLVAETSRELMKNLLKFEAKQHPQISMAKRVYKKYKQDGLLFEVFYDLVQQNCFYCNAPPGNEQYEVHKNSSQYFKDNCKFIYNGLDRINPTKGHTADNVVPCCFMCNAAKSNMSLSDFLSWLQNLCSHTLSRLNPDQPPTLPLSQTP